VPFEFERLDLPGLVLIHPRVFADDRGAFLETYHQQRFEEAGITDRFVQSNLSTSKRGVVRGLHFQKQPRAQAKLVHVVEGEVYDVVVGIRRDAPGYGTWHSVRLSAENRCLLYIPAWYAHGFCALSETAQVVYSVSAEYAPELERGILWNDATLGIDWPVEAPIVSEKDQTWPPFAAADIDDAWPDALPTRPR
jgi:dTDP-4-dehydrorhamnose 3,5-epimerase